MKHAKKHSPNPLVKYASLILIACSLVVLTAVLFFLKQRVEAEKSLAATQAEAAIANVLAPCRAAASLYGVQPAVFQETFDTSINNTRLWTIFGREAHRVRTQNGRLVLAAKNDSVSFRNAGVTLNRPVAGDAAFQTVLATFRQTSGPVGEAPTRVVIDFVDKQGSVRSQAVVAVRQDTRDASKVRVEAAAQYPHTSSGSDVQQKFPLSGTITLPSSRGVKLRVVRVNDGMRVMAKSQDGGQSPFTELVHAPLQPEELFATASLSVDAARKSNSQAVELRAEYNNFRVFCPDVLRSLTADDGSE